MKQLVKCAVLGATLLVSGRLLADSSDGKPIAESKTDMKARVQVAEETLTRLRRNAAANGDAILIGCLNDKQLKLKAAANRFDSELASDTLGPAMSTLSQIDSIVRAAQECKGKVALGDAAASSETIAPTFTDNPTAGSPLGEGGTQVEDPTYASPFT